jgi:hypothetical protein
LVDPGNSVSGRDHVFCSFLALLLKAGLKRRMKFADLGCEWVQVLRGLDALRRVEAKIFLLLRQPTGQTSAWQIPTIRSFRDETELPGRTLFLTFLSACREGDQDLFTNFTGQPTRVVFFG